MSFEIERSGYYSTADALVVPAKADLKKCDQNKAIFKEAGNWSLYFDCRKNKGCKLGDAIITEGYNTRFKYLIHAVCLNENGSYSNSTEVIHDCYKSILDAASKKGISSLAIPMLAEETGTPEDEVHEAYLMISNYAESNDMDITLAY